MNLKVFAIILLLSLCFFFGFKNFSGDKIQNLNSNIDELKILNYLPNNSNFLFVSNLSSANIDKSIKKNFNKINRDKLNLIRISALAYLGLDLGKNDLEDIYNNELTISTYDNEDKTQEDLLLVFKIKPEKKIDDILNLSNLENENEEIIKIYRKDKLNYLKYVYLTKDNYIIASSNKKLLLESRDSRNNREKTKKNYDEEILRTFKNEKNILLTKKPEKSIFINDKIYPENIDDTILTTFFFKDDSFVLRSYLVNNKGKKDIFSYDKLKTANIKKKDDYLLNIYSNSKEYIECLSPSINNFEKTFLEKLSRKLNQNILLKNSDNEWIIAIEKNKQNSPTLENLEELKEFTKYSLEKDDKIFSIYSKNILEKNETNIKQLKFKDIFKVETKSLYILSNNLLNDLKIDLISQEFSYIQKMRNTGEFLNKQIHIKGPCAQTSANISSSDTLNFFMKQIIDFSTSEFEEISLQLIPEKDPLIYTEKTIKMLK